MQTQLGESVADQRKRFDCIDCACPVGARFKLLVVMRCISRSTTRRWRSSSSALKKRQSDAGSTCCCCCCKLSRGKNAMTLSRGECGDSSERTTVQFNCCISQRDNNAADRPVNRFGSSSDSTLTEGIESNAVVPDAACCHSLSEAEP